MTRRREFDERKLLKVYLDEREWKWVTLQAADGSVSAWARKELLQRMPLRGDTFDRPVIVSMGSQPLTGYVNGEVSESIAITLKPKPPKKTCPHGKSKDFYCGMCQGKAVVDG